MGCEDRGGEGLRGDAAGEGGVVVDVEFEDCTQEVSYGLEGFLWGLNGGKEGGNKDVRWKNSSVTKSMVQFTSFSTPKKSSRGRPVSLQTGKGMYCKWPAASVICFCFG